MHVPNDEYLELKCANCSANFVICRGCYRGHRYCSPTCRDRAYAEARKRARRKYAQSPEARLDHRDRNRIYRRRFKWREKDFVMDKSSMTESLAVILQNVKSAMRTCRCIVCGQDFSQREMTADENGTSECTFNFSDP